MAEIPGPLDLLDLANGQSVTFRILKAERGETRIETRLEPQGKVVPVLRLHVPPEDKPMGAPDGGVTALTLQARLEPIMMELIASGRRLKVTKFGTPPAARHQVDFLPRE